MQAFGEDAANFATSGRWLLPHAESGISSLAKELIGLSEQHPSLKIFLPHLGWPRHNGEDDCDWHNAISSLSRLPNIVVGVSAIAHFSQRPFPHEDIEPFAAHLLGVFGVTALVAASDYPLMEKSRYAEYMQLARDWTGWRSDRPSRLDFNLFQESRG
jgi:predicted TIM-barrel fold metal-dependent hydrolase